MADLLTNSQMAAMFLLLFLLSIFFVYIRNPKYDSNYRKVTIYLASILMIVLSFIGSINLCKGLQRCGGPGKGKDGKPQDAFIVFLKGGLYYAMAGFCALVVNFFSQDRCSYDENSPLRWTILGLTIAIFVINVVLLVVHILTMSKETTTEHTGQGLLAPARA